MADDSESDRPSSDADESVDSSPDDTETPEPSDTPTEEASAPSDDSDSGDFDSDGATDDVDDVTLEREDLIPPPDEESDGMETAGGTETDAADAEPDSEADSGTDAEDDSGTDAEDDSGTDAEDDSGTDAEDDSGTDAETDNGSEDDTGTDAEDLWPDDHEPPKTKTAEEMGLTDDESEEAITNTDGGAPANATIDGTDPEPPAEISDDGVFGDGPESDEEMPLADHIEEMVRRLAVVFAIGGIITLILYPGADLANSALHLNLTSSTDVINFLWNKHIPGAPEIAERRPRVYGPLELVLTELKVAGLAGLVIGLPVFVYETYLFMRPGLFPKERRYYLAAVPTSLILAFIGIAFAHFVVLPTLIKYFTSYTQGTAVIAFGLKETFNLILILMGYNAIIFQIPLFIMLAIMMNLVTRQWLVARRLIFWASFLGLAFFVSPDPTGMAPIIIAATMITLFEGTLLLLRWTGN
ncbi:twin-arginine translocase subunit TatC [Halogeometricum borinquense]|uniref:Sec-independent protein translocase protein TatC n=1 Tax=Halogeometricum borinquense (strain ATCC 700274 / DSM 11551 / JCM 10706 / KCTC 4070 / PR3) TaxID=469382 RepID=E4NRH7_HALBP|nr:twin-arginine translocase subunit TatC [Halogeometricum borinquense]ADQ65653.1 Sec-independent protein secretion pathway component TatC [Halogeometricum borinquense DSM 11551]